jgi:probable HAF family extracellular repeat protein
MGINDSGDVAGASATPAGYLHAFFWTGSGMQDLGTLGGTSSFAYGINGWGDVVGCSFVAESENTHAFLWMGSGLFDLNGLLAANSGWVLNEAYGINDSGQIVGMGTYQGQSRAFRLDPERVQFAGLAIGEAGVPEPGTFMLLGIGMVLIGAGARGVYRNKR